MRTAEAFLAAVSKGVAAFHRQSQLLSANFRLLTLRPCDQRLALTRHEEREFARGTRNGEARTNRANDVGAERMQ